MTTPGATPQPPIPTGERLPELDVLAPQRQRRWTVLLRALLLIPHFIVVAVLGIAALFVMVCGWFGALFMGRLPNWVGNFLAGFLTYATRINCYLYFLVDTYPPFGWADPHYSVQVLLPPPERLNRVAVFFRFILVIPVGVLAALFNGGLSVLGFFLWVAVLIMGRTPRPVFDSVAAVQRFAMRVQAYWMLLTPAYPKKVFGDGPRPGGQPAQGSPVPPPAGYPDMPHPGASQPGPGYQATAYPAGYQGPGPEGGGMDPGYQGYAPMPGAGTPPGQQPRYSDTRPLLVSSGAKALMIIMIVLGVFAQAGNATYQTTLYGTSMNGTPDQNAVVSTLDDYYEALSAGEGQRACEQLSADLKDTITTQTGTSTCPQGIDAVHRSMDAGTKRNLGNLRYDASTVRVNGNRAILTGRDLAKTNNNQNPNSIAGAIMFVKESGDWKIATLS